MRSRTDQGSPSRRFQSRYPGKQLFVSLVQSGGENNIARPARAARQTFTGPMCGRGSMKFVTYFRVSTKLTSQSKSSPRLSHPPGNPRPLPHEHWIDHPSVEVIDPELSSVGRLQYPSGAISLGDGPPAPPALTKSPLRAYPISAFDLPLPQRSDATCSSGSALSLQERLGTRVQVQASRNDLGTAHEALVPLPWHLATSFSADSILRHQASL